MKFDLTKYNTCGLEYKNDGQIPSSKIKDGKIINTNVNFIKPYKIQIRASKMMSGKIKVAKKTLTFEHTITLIDAIKQASKEYEQMMVDLEIEQLKPQAEFYHPEMLFKDLWEDYQKYKARTKDTLADWQFYNKWLKKPLDNKKFNEITAKNIMDIRDSMFKPDGVTPLADRTKNTVNQMINPLYSYFNDIAQNKYVVNSKAKLIKARYGKVENIRELTLDLSQIIDAFRELRDYPITPFREIFMWLMHGRRRNEVLTLKWSDIDLKANTYTIRKENNKARTDMTYHLSDRLRATLNVLKGTHNIEQMKGFVFKSIKNDSINLNEGTLRNHWDRTVVSHSMVLHQIRDCIAMYLKNKHLITNDIVGPILGHTQTQTITDRYGTFGYQVLNDKLNLMLDEVFEDDFSPKPIIDEKLVALRSLFPNKSDDKLLKVLEILND